MANESEQEKRDTLADIVEEIRAYGAQPPPRLMWLEIADRIEAAWERERTEIEANAARHRRNRRGFAAPLARLEPTKRRERMNSYEQMRETLVVVRDAIITIDAHKDDKEFVNTWLALTAKEVNKAIALPRRQCDVGTPNEQSARYDEYCYQNRTIEHCCANCPVVSSANCELAWAQTPYEVEEGGAE